MAKNNRLERTWAGESRLNWTGDSFEINHDWRIPGTVLTIDEILHQVSNSNGPQFEETTGPRGRKFIKRTVLANWLISIAKHCDPMLVRQFLPRHTFSPYFEVWESRWRDILKLRGVLYNPENVAFLNEWFDQLRGTLRELPFRDEVNRQKRAANKNAKGFREYLDALFRLHAKLQVVRVDFGYHREVTNDPNRGPPTDKEVKEHLKKILRYIRRYVPSVVGIVWKLEYGAIKGFHIHAMVICNGQKVREGQTWGRLIGEQWQIITGKTGVFWNCNANERMFEAAGRRGIGMISYDDEHRREGLMDVGMYMVKTDVYARFVSPDIGRTFGKSINVEKKGNLGRPRKYQDPVESKKAG